MVEIIKPIEDSEGNRNKDFSELLPSHVLLANRIISGINSTKGDAYKFVEIAMAHTVGKDGIDKDVTITWHGTEEVDIADWNHKIEDYVADEDYFNKTFCDLVKECGFLTDDEKKRLLGDEEKEEKCINEVAMNYIAKQLYLKGRAVFENESGGGVVDDDT